MTACASNSPQSAPVPVAATTHPASATPLSCKQQYTAWQTGPAKPYGKKLETALNAVQSAGATDDIPDTLADLKAAGPVAAQSEQYPMPGLCRPGRLLE